MHIRSVVPTDVAGIVGAHVSCHAHVFCYAGCLGRCASSVLCAFEPMQTTLNFAADPVLFYARAAQLPVALHRHHHNHTQSTAHHSAAQHSSAAQRSAAHQSIAQHGIAQHSTAQQSTTQQADFLVLLLLLFVSSNWRWQPLCDNRFGLRWRWQPLCDNRFDRFDAW